MGTVAREGSGSAEAVLLWSCITALCSPAAAAPELLAGLVTLEATPASCPALPPASARAPWLLGYWIPAVRAWSCAREPAAPLVAFPAAPLVAFPAAPLVAFPALSPTVLLAALAAAVLPCCWPCRLLQAWARA